MERKAQIRAIFTLSYPIVIAQVGGIFQGWADTIMVGQYGTPELSSAGFVNNVFNLCIFFLLGISYATTPIVGNYFSQGKYGKVLSTFCDSNVVNLLASFFIIVLLFILYLNIDHLGQPVELLPLIRPYFLVLLVSLPFMSLFNSMKQFLDALGDTKTPMWVMLGGNILNIILNYVFIFTLDMGLLGAGIATLISRAVMPLVIYVIIKRGKLLRSPNFVNAEKDVDKDGVQSLFRLGLPISIQLCLEAGSFNVVVIFLGWIGAAALAAHQIMNTVCTLAFMVYYGIGAAAAIRIAFFRGQGEWEEVRKTASTAFWMCISSGVVIIAAICLFSPQIASLFTTDEEVTMLFFSFLPCMVCYQAGDCLQIIYANALRAVEHVRAMMLSAFIAYCLISVPLAYVFAFPLGMGAVGVWWSFPFGLSFAGLSYYFLFHRLTKRQSSIPDTF